MGGVEEDAAPDGAPGAIDVAAIKAKYRAERDKRLRPDGTGQYVPLRDLASRLEDDPYADPAALAREPVVAETEALIVGCGFGGLLAGARLREAGVADIRMIDRAGDVGGTWYWNRYPGAACDIESYVYLPMLEAFGDVPIEKYSKAPEIWEHAKKIARTYDLYPGALFNTVATEMRWDEARKVWIVSTDRGDRITARFVVVTGGSLDRPKVPGIPGVETFAGHVFHTSRWDYAYTGGDGRGGLTGLADKRVGIIGTGATAIQCVPHLAEGSKHLYVFQRTPSAVGARNNQPTDQAWASTLEPGWQQRRIENFNNLVSVSDTVEEIDLVQDGWTEVMQRVLLIRRRLAAEGRPAGEIAAIAEMADIEQMEAIRGRVASIVRDPATAEALKPYYAYFCKRPCFHDEYLQAFNRPNVTLVDTGGLGVEAITPAGCVVAGREYPLDCLIFATGFDYAASRRDGPFIHGRGGLSLDDKFATGAATLHGMMSHGFPNLFVVDRKQTGVTTNITHMLREQAAHIAYVIGEARRRGAAAVEPSAEAEDAWVAHCETVAILRRKFFEECTPGYFNNEGQVRPYAARNAQYGAGPAAFIRVLEAWRAAGDLPGLVLAQA